MEQKFKTCEEYVLSEFEETKKKCLEQEVEMNKLKDKVRQLNDYLGVIASGNMAVNVMEQEFSYHLDIPVEGPVDNIYVPEKRNDRYILLKEIIEKYGGKVWKN